MLYQQLFGADKPYVANITTLMNMAMHFHCEFEMIYCISGSFHITQNGKTEAVNEGDIVIVGSMIPHAYSNNNNAQILLIELGPVFLKENFSKLSNIYFEKTHFTKENSSLYSNLYVYIDEILEAIQAETAGSNLIVVGNLYKLCAAIIDADEKIFVFNNTANKSFHSIKEALELVYHHYDKELTVEKAAEATGYGKANFCKIFKNTTGVSFHAYLNDYRVKTACYLLVETDFSIERIGEMVGFKEAKTFCQVFKKFIGITPGQYRKHNAN
ncbi:MAG: AraC family transcriptional regulator [Clostridia bacterium]|nr:AraC family transcriptional regulator [Clostridia bacterium]